MCWSMAEQDVLHVEHVSRLVGDTSKLVIKFHDVYRMSYALQYLWDIIMSNCMASRTINQPYQYNLMYPQIADAHI